MTPTTRPFSFRYANFYNLAAEYAPSDRASGTDSTSYVCETASRFYSDIRMQGSLGTADNRCRNPAGGPSGPPCSITN